MRCVTFADEYCSDRSLLLLMSNMKVVVNSFAQGAVDSTQNLVITRLSTAKRMGQNMRGKTFTK